MTKISLALLTGTLLSHSAYAFDNITDAITGGKTHANFNFRYETVEQDNALKDATALTLRTRLGYTTGVYKNFSAMIEMEDSRIVGGFDEYSVPPNGFNSGTYSVIPDPEHTELDQGFIKYKNDTVTAKLGRQVITYDGHRFIGHVGWRQDRQTFDALKFDFKATDKLDLSYSYIFKRNRIFSESADVDTKDSLLNVSYKSPIGKITGYGYLLEIDNDTDNALDTYGISLNGSAGSDKKFKYKLEFATQTAESPTTEFDADYIALEGSMVLSGITAKLGYEVLGSDSGNYGFSTPLATLHKFNGLADVFLATPDQGLVDISIKAITKLGGGKIIFAYHDFSADESSSSVDDLGSEIDFVYAKKFGKNYVTGIKYASYSAGDIKTDTDKLWLWAGLKF